MDRVYVVMSHTWSMIAVAQALRAGHHRDIPIGYELPRPQHKDNGYFPAALDDHPVKSIAIGIYMPAFGQFGMIKAHGDFH